MPVYLDHNATSPQDPRVTEAMLPWLTGEKHGNPSSLHAFGQAAREAMEAARELVADFVGGIPPEVVFCASGTEANNNVMVSLARAADYQGRIVLSSLEHSSIRKVAEDLETRGMEVVRVEPGPDGVVPVEAFREAVDGGAVLAALMLANNEVGTIQPVAEVAHACREAGVPLLCDAVQAAGKVPIDVGELGADFVVVAGHKFHGPLGAAALWIKSGVEIDPYLLGGGQERRRRASTENVPAVVGLGRCCELAGAELSERRTHLARLRDRFESGLATIPGAIVHCSGSPRLPHTSHVAFLGCEGEALLIRLDLAGFAVSTGSACSSGAAEPSPTLTAMGIVRDEALASLRVSFGMPNTADEVDAFLVALAREVEALRRLIGYSPQAAAACEYRTPVEVVS